MSRYNPRQARDKFGRWTSGRKVSAVPYTRHSLRSQTAGINAGTNISKNYRVSAGAHFRIERRTPSRLEGAIIQKNNSAIKRLVKKVSPGEHLDPVIEKTIRKAQNRVTSKVLGKTLNLGKKANVRGGTTRSGLPSVTVRYGGSRKSAARRAAGISQYNSAMQGRRVSRAAAKAPRPQRRGK